MSRLSWTTAGESHGKALVGVLSGLPAGLALALERVDGELERRQGGYGRGGRMKIERDRAAILSGVRAGRTLGSPIALEIVNRDATIEALPVPRDPRPGHADLSGCQKLWMRDPRAVLERASARETAMRVALAGVARQLLEHFGIEIFAHVVELGGLAVDEARVGEAFAASGGERAARRAASAFFALDPQADEPLRQRVDAARQAGDSLGGVFEVRALGLPPGLGSYHSGPERLTSRLGAALLSIPAIKAVAFGLGFEAARLPGSKVQDPIVARGPGPWGRFGRASNHAGGLEGGVTTGEPLVVRAAMKPIPTLRQGVATVDFETGEERLATYQRSDVTSVPAASVVGEAMVALELAAAFLERFSGDALAQVEAAFEAHREALRRL